MGSFDGDPIYNLTEGGFIVGILVLSDYINYNRIIIDTSSLMQGKGLSKLINCISGTLMCSRQRIIVPTAVWLELTRHMNSKNQSLAAIAGNAIHTVNCNRDIFQIEDKYVDYSDTDSAFADKEIYADLVVHKTKYRQLLITNDIDLARDIRAINKQKSCNGYHIDVCRLSKAGNLLEHDFSQLDNQTECLATVEKTGEINAEKYIDSAGEPTVNSNQNTNTDKKVSGNEDISANGKAGIISLLIYATLTTASTGLLLWEKYKYK